MTRIPRCRAAVLPTLAALLSACGDGAPGAPRAEAMATGPFCEAAMAGVNEFMASAGQANQAGDEYGGTAVVGGITELVNGMNAFQAIGVNQRQHQQFVNLMTLVQVDDQLEPTPWLAESWELSEEGTSLTFRLRDDVYWHDGEQTDAYDVAFTYRTVVHPETAYPNSAFFARYAPGDEAVEVVDSFTVTFRMEPHAEVLDPWRVLAIMPEHLLGDVPPTEMGEHPFATQCPVGNGPFVFLSHSTDESWVFEANPAFPAGLGGRPYVDRLIYRIVPEQTTLLTELLTGSVDLFVNVRPDQAGAILESDAAELRVIDAGGFQFVAWNSRRPQLRDPRVRRALTLGLDRQAVVDAILRGYGALADGGVPPFHWAYDDDRPGLSYDPAGARALLDEAGWTDRDGDGIRENREGTALEVEVIFNAADQNRRTIAELMQAQLREVGVEVNLLPLEGRAIGARIANPEVRDFDGAILEWFHEFRVDETDLFASGDGPYAFAGVQDAALDRLMAQLQTQTDRQTARPLWRRYQERISELHPFTYLYFGQQLAGVSNRLQGVETDARGFWVNVKDWRIAPSDR